MYYYLSPAINEVTETVVFTITASFAHFVICTINWVYFLYVVGSNIAIWKQLSPGIMLRMQRLINNWKYEFLTIAEIKQECTNL